MPYREIAPAPALRDWVDCFWFNDGSDGRPTTVLPDGAADIIFDIQRDEASVVGTMTEPVVVPASDRDLVGVRFKPGRAAAILGVPLRDLTNARVPLRDVTSAIRIDGAALVEQELLRRVARIEGPDGRIDAAIALIQRAGGNVTIDRVAGEACMTRQHLRRKFLDEVGISPKTFARVMRFQRLLEAMGRGDVDSWADAASAHGFTDQSHMIAEFRELAGTTPKRFQTSYR